MRGTKRFTAFLLLVLLVVPLAARQKPSWRRPITRDHDMQNVPEPRVKHNSQYYDFLDATFFQQAKQAFDFPRYARKKPALNVNAIDQVPDSSWFTNRMGRRPLTLDELRRGPNRGEGPDTSAPWTIVAGKTPGVTPGFTIRDARGDRYLIKFDPVQNPEMASGAEAVATRVYFACGYNTPETYIVRFRPEDLHLSEEAEFIDTQGRKRVMNDADLQEILGMVGRLPDGRVRALASKFLPGRPKGPFQYYGVRKDDQNDWIPHEHRRELRGLRVIAGWLHDNDIREQNTLDTYVTEDGRSFLRHFLIDAGSALGSDSIKPNIERVGFEYIYDHGETTKSLLSAGLYQRPWAYRRILHSPAVGYIDAERFDPYHWKPNYPIVAFENMSTADGYWAAKIVQAFSDEHIRAAVAAGEYSDSQAAEYLARVLIERRNKIARYWFARAGGLDDFELVPAAGNAALRFRDRNVEAGFASPAERRYRYRTVGAKNSNWQELPAGGELAIPLAPLGENGISVIEVEARDSLRSAWAPPVSVHIGYRDARFHILGWVREED